MTQQATLTDRILAHPILPRAQQAELLASMCAARDRQERRVYERLRARVVACNMKLAARVAHRYAGRGLDFEDLVSYGAEGLLRACDTYDHERGLAFSTYALRWALHAIGRAVDNYGRTVRIPVGSVAQCALLMRAQQHLSPAATPSELAAASGLPLATVERLTHTDWRDPRSLSEQIGDCEGEAVLGDLLPDSAPSPEDLLSAAQEAWAREFRLSKRVCRKWKRGRLVLARGEGFSMTLTAPPRGTPNMANEVQFTPVDTGNMADIPPEAPEGVWEARCKVEKMATKKDGYPMLKLEFKTTLALTEGNEEYAGCRLTTWVNLPPRGAKSERMAKQNVATLCKAFGIAPPDTSSLAQGSWESLEPFIAALEEGTWTIYSKHRVDRSTGEVRVDVAFTAPKIKL